MIKTRKTYSANQMMLINEMADIMRRLFIASDAEDRTDAKCLENRDLWVDLARARKETRESIQSEAYYIAKIAKKYHLNFEQYTHISGVHAWCLRLDIKDVDTSFPGRAHYLPIYLNNVLRSFDAERQREQPDWKNLDIPFHKAVRNIEANGIYIGFDVTRRGKEKIWIADTLVPEGVVRGLTEKF